MFDTARHHWRIDESAGLEWRFWDDEYVFHHALSNDTHRLSEPAGAILLYLLEHGETAEDKLATSCGLDREDVDIILSALTKIDFVAWHSH
jgi:transcription initiation factor IIE alpha subunit